MGETAHFKWPYPALAEVADVPADLQQLLEAIEATVHELKVSELGTGGAPDAKKLLIVQNTGAAAWKAMSGDATISEAGAITIANEAITAAKLAALAVTEAKLAGESVSTAKIKLLAITAALLAAEAVETAKIKAEAVTAAKLAGESVETAKIKALAVTAAKLAAEAVETAKLANLAVTEAKIAAGAVSTAKLADGAVTEVKIGNGAVSEAKLAEALKTLVVTQPVRSTVEQLKVIRGIVDTSGAGSIVKGSGFTIERLGVGKIKIFFTANFTDVPTVTAVAGGGVTIPEEPTKAQASLTREAGVDGTIHFIAMGPR